MDCLDCHSRPAHTLAPRPGALNEATGQGRIPRELPVRPPRSAAAITPEYADRQAALQAVAARLLDHYLKFPSVDEAVVQRAIAGTQDLWARNVIPAMTVTWGTYPNHSSHINTPGCFRCHDDEHATRDGRVIKQDCEMCHKEQEQSQ